MNDAPIFVSIPLTSADEDEEYSYGMVAEDIDEGDELTFTAQTLPGWLTFDGVAMISGMPLNEHVGTHAVVLTVSDGFVTVNQEFTITVANTNDPPVFTSTPTASGIEDAEYSYTATASDIDVGDSLTYAAQALPDWLTFDGVATISGIALNEHVGTHAVVLTVSDGFVTVNQEFTITVANTNDAPVFTSVPDTSSLEDAEYSLSLIHI